MSHPGIEAVRAALTGDPADELAWRWQPQAECEPCTADEACTDCGSPFIYVHAATRGDPADPAGEAVCRCCFMVRAGTWEGDLPPDVARGRAQPVNHSSRERPPEVAQ